MMREEHPALPLTGPQLGMWAGQQLDPHSPSFWTGEAIELDGPLDAAALEASIREALGACDALHMRYADQGEGVRQRLRERRNVLISREDYADCSDPWASAWQWMREDLLRNADLGQRPLFATALIRIAEQRHLWYLRAHHIALDGFGYLLLIHRVAELYSARIAGREPPPARDWSLAPVIAEETVYRQSPACLDSRRFWTQHLAGAGEPVTLGPKCAPADSSHSQRSLLPPADYAQWQGAARRVGVDWSAWLIAAIFAWMRVRSGEFELSIGLLVMNRLGSVALGVPCMAMNVVPLRLRVPPEQSFDALARAVAAQLRELRPHQRYNYEWLRNDLGLGDSHAQLYGPVVNIMPFDRGFVFEGLRSRAHPVSVGSVEDLDITVSPLAEGLRFDIEANPDAYPAPVLAAHQAALLRLIATVAAEPSIALHELARRDAAGHERAAA
ncbi:condensation domain-containing protein [Lysobacter sp. CA199]|uniref:condensation domain-containing protein n=1 Tax=Lysobacter sp. CA199 TaxID=3455608 RepID=UPI003F8D7722